MREQLEHMQAEPAGHSGEAGGVQKRLCVHELSPKPWIKMHHPKDERQKGVSLAIAQDVLHNYAAKPKFTKTVNTIRTWWNG